MKSRTTIRTIEFTLERTDLRVIASERRQLFGICPICEGRTRFLAPEEGGEVSPRRIYSLIEKRRVYFSESTDGSVIVCSDCIVRETNGLNGS